MSALLSDASGRGRGAQRQKIGGQFELRLIALQRSQLALRRFLVAIEQQLAHVLDARGGVRAGRFANLQGARQCRRRRRQIAADLGRREQFLGGGPITASGESSSKDGAEASSL